MSSPGPDEPALDAEKDGDEAESASSEGREGSATPANFELGPRFAASRRWLWGLAALALASRLVWNLLIHPPGNYVFSDMKKYVTRAQDLAVNGFHPGVREFAWQAWGTHYLLSVPLKLFGPENYVAAGVFWAFLGALAVPVGYLLACRICSRPIHAKIVGVALLLWHPSISNGGNFLSETPYLAIQLLSTLLLVVVLQTGRRSIAAGLVSAAAFAIRPQAALFFVLVLATWAFNVKRLRKVRARQLIAIALPLLLMLGFSFWRFHAHTGYWSGIAENGNMNLTAGRCHNIVTQAFRTERQKRRSERMRSTRDGRRVSLPGFRLLAKTYKPQHPLALRPALRSETIRFVGYVGDPETHREIRRACYQQTGFFEQARYSMVNASLLWFVGQQWPEMEKGRKKFLPPIVFFKHFYQIVVWLPSLIGILVAVGWIRRRPAWSFVAWQLLTSITIAAIFFGTIRLRTPYDPYAIILAVEVWSAVLVWGWARLFRRRVERAPAPDEATSE